MKIKIMTDNEEEIIESYIFTDVECNALRKIMDTMTES